MIDAIWGDFVDRFLQTFNDIKCERYKILYNTKTYDLLFDLIKETAVVVLSFVLAYFVRRYLGFAWLRGLAISPNYWGVLLIFLLSGWLIIFYRHSLSPPIGAKFRRLWAIFYQAIISVIIAIFLLYILKIEGVSRSLIALYCINYAVVKIFLSLFARSVFERLKCKELFVFNYIAIGDKEWLANVYNLAEDTLDQKMTIHLMETKLFGSSNENTKLDIKKQSELIKSLGKILIEGVVDGVILPIHIGETRICRVIIRLCRKVGIGVYFVGEKYHGPGYFTSTETISSKVIIKLDPIANSPKQLIKRAIDIILSLILLILLLPILLLAALTIKIISPFGPVIYIQKRMGYNRRVFRCFKLRTMVPSAENSLPKILDKNEMNGPVFKCKNDPRIIPIIGKFMRKTCIDELPQLVNVFKGEMSLVGPRPPIPDEVRKYPMRYHKRLSVKPGITCLWQCTKNRNDMKFERWMELDHKYIDNWSLSLDLYILIKTVRAVLTAQGR